MSKDKAPNINPVYRRKNTGKNRKIRHLLQQEHAGQSIGPITKGIDIFGITKGQFSLINIMEHVIQYTGPVDITIATWTTSDAETKKLYDFLESGAIRTLRLLVDRSFSTRRPETCQRLIEAFGPDCIRATRTHAKFVTLRNSEWNMVIRTSANLNENKRIEVFDISDDADMATYCDNMIDMLFADPLDWTASTFSTFSSGGGVGGKDIFNAPKAPEKIEVDLGTPDWDIDIDF